MWEFPKLGESNIDPNVGSIPHPILGTIRDITIGFRVSGTIRDYCGYINALVTPH